ncbi:porin [Burkholderia multivorans]|uniref:porin n=1 Tax=Burkholderiaceae TaxID=119060 RepID=UPI00057E339C|nr:porin [Burkholderia multivorans]KHS13868.1 porin [Burkholderia multivorans]MDR9227680.1 Outer membrane porin protein [Burkholderia multivorans]HDR9471927.1 porin [Burkholderia multivorans]
MKKQAILLASFGVLSSAAYAQSSVTLYGIVDVGVLYVNNAVSGGKGGQQWSLASSNLQGSRFGLRGTEDLGGGLSALFVLENGFTTNNGKLAQGGDLFGRQAFVGLSSQKFGMLTLGRQYDSVVDYTGFFEVGAQWGSYYGSHPGDLDNMLNTLRVNNAIKYTSNSYAGFKFGGLYSLGGVAGDVSRNQIWSVGAGYSGAQLQAGVAYLNVRDPNFSFFGNNSSSSTSGSNMGGSTVYSGYASARTQQIISAGMSYVLGSATLGATYSNTQFKNIGALAGLPAVGAGGTAKFHNAEINFKYQITPTLLAGVAYDYTKGYGVNDAKYNQFVAGVDYFLSKRTDLYIAGVYQHASGTDSTGHAAVANISSLSPSSTSNQVATVLGIRHKF